MLPICCYRRHNSTLLPNSDYWFNAQEACSKSVWGKRKQNTCGAQGDERREMVQVNQISYKQHWRLLWQIADKSTFQLISIPPRSPSQQVSSFPRKPARARITFYCTALSLLICHRASHTATRASGCSFFFVLPSPPAEQGGFPHFQLYHLKELWHRWTNLKHSLPASSHWPKRVDKREQLSTSFKAGRLPATQGYSQGLEPAVSLTEQGPQWGAGNAEAAPEHHFCQPQRAITAGFKAPLALSRWSCINYHLDLPKQFRLCSSNAPNIKSHYLKKVREQNRRYIGVLVEGQYSELHILSCSHWSYRAETMSFPSNFIKF